MATQIGELQVGLKFDAKGFKYSMQEVESASSGTGSRLSKIWAVIGDSIVRDIAVKAFGAATSAVKSFSTSVISVGSNFERSMSEVAAITGATGDDLALLEQTARDFGSSTVFSASEAADALKYMGLAGWDANQSASAIGGVLDLAAASGMELAAASDMVTDYLSAFGMEAEQSAYFADMLTYAQNNSNTTAEALGEAYKNCAANLNAAGQDVETTTSLLSMMANQGLKGSEAGTVLNAVMRDMTAKMEDGAIAIGNTVVQVMDANGNYRDMTDILRDVEAATNGMGDAEKAAALSSTFTDDSIKGLNLTMNAGVDNAAAFEEELRKSGGTAAATADIMNSNLQGQLKTLNSNYKEVALTVYNRFLPALTSGAGGINSLVSAIGQALSGQNPQEAISEFVTGFGSALVDSLSQIGAGIGQVVPVILQAVVGILPALLQGLILAAVNLVQGLAAALPNIFSALTDALIGIIDILTSPAMLNMILSAGIQLLTQLVNAIPIIIPKLVATIPMIIENILNFFITSAPTLLNGVLQLFQAIIQAIPIIIQALATALPTIINAITNFLTEGDTIQLILNAAISAFMAIIQALPQIIEALAAALPDILTSIIEFLTSPGTIMMLLNAAITLFFALVQAVPQILGALIGAFGSLVGSLWESIKRMFGAFASNFGEFIGGIFKGAINGLLAFIENMINTPINLLNGFIDGINSVFGIVGVSIDHIGLVSLPRMEYGGIVPGNSYSGDHNLIRANSGEMVITRNQQADLWNFIQGSFQPDSGDSASTDISGQRPIINQTNYFEKELTEEQIEDLMSKSIRRATV